jgi:hypothetical protein
MSIQLLQQKLTLIKEASPTKEDFLNSGFDLNYATAIAQQYHFEFNEANNHSAESLFELYRMTVSSRQFSVFGLSLCEVEEEEDFYQIGNSDADLLILIKATQEIALLDIENGEIIAYIAKDFAMFLDLLPLLVLYDKIGYLGQKYTAEVKNKTVEKIIQLIVDPKYYSFFSFSINGR